MLGQCRTFHPGNSAPRAYCLECESLRVRKINPQEVFLYPLRGALVECQLLITPPRPIRSQWSGNTELLDLGSLRRIAWEHLSFPTTAHVYNCNQHELRIVEKWKPLELRTAGVLQQLVALFLQHTDQEIVCLGSLLSSFVQLEQPVSEKLQGIPVISPVTVKFNPTSTFAWSRGKSRVAPNTWLYPGVPSRLQWRDNWFKCPNLLELQAERCLGYHQLQNAVEIYSVLLLAIQAGMTFPAELWQAEDLPKLATARDIEGLWLDINVLTRLRDLYR